MKNLNLGVILARSGSKGLEVKILKMFVATLMAYSIYAGLKSKYLNRLVVSTDKKIAKIAENYKSAPFKTKKLAGDQIWLEMCLNMLF